MRAENAQAVFLLDEDYGVETRATPGAIEFYDWFGGERGIFGCVGGAQLM